MLKKLKKKTKIMLKQNSIDKTGKTKRVLKEIEKQKKAGPSFSIVSS